MPGAIPGHQRLLARKACAVHSSYGVWIHELRAANTAIQQVRAWCLVGAWRYARSKTARHSDGLDNCACVLAGRMAACRGRPGGVGWRRGVAVW